MGESRFRRTEVDCGEQPTASIRSRDAARRKTQTRSPADLGAITHTDTWASFHAAFDRLSKEEISCSLENRQDLRISATSMGEMKEWHFREGLDESFHERVLLLAIQAGAKLGTPRDSTKLNHWMYRLYLDLRARRSKLLFAPIQEDPKCVSIASVCEASAIFCARLEQEAVESSQSKPNLRKRKASAVMGPEVKLADAAKFPTMTVQEVMAILRISRASVYRYLAEGRLNRPGLNKKPGKKSKTLVLTGSVQEMLRPAEE
jgi:hypothetical protein